MVEKEVEIYGKKYLLRAESEGLIVKVAELLDQKLKNIFGQPPKPLNLSQTFALAINLAEELVNLQKEQEREREEIARRLDQIINQLTELENLIEI